jgi:hypothetical protein
MQAITTVGLDIAKSVFQVHAIDAEGNVIVRRQSPSFGPNRRIDLRQNLYPVAKIRTLAARSVHGADRSLRWRLRGIAPKARFQRSWVTSRSQPRKRRPNRGISTSRQRLI